MSTSKAATGAETKVKAQYRVTNWREYDRALVERGSLTVWFDEEFVRTHWRPEANGKRGGALLTRVGF